jgi:hypothetical protein
MSSRRGYLVNNVNPSLVESNEYDVRAGVVRIYGANLGGTLPINVWVGDEVNGIWVNLYRNGTQIALSDTNNSYVEFVPGKYRIDASAAGPGALVWFEEAFDTDGDDRTKWVYVTNNSASVSNSSPSSIVTTNTCFANLNGDGSAVNPLSVDLNISPDPGNLIFQNCNDPNLNQPGLYARLYTDNTNCVWFNGAGTQWLPLSAGLAFVPSGSPENNIIDCSNDESQPGLYLAGPASFPIIVVNTIQGSISSSITLTVSNLYKIGLTAWYNDQITLANSSPITFNVPNAVNVAGGTYNGGLLLKLATLNATVLNAADNSSLPFEIDYNGIGNIFSFSNVVVYIPSPSVTSIKLSLQALYLI